MNVRREMIVFIIAMKEYTPVFSLCLMIAIMMLACFSLLRRRQKLN